jgi:hypothetical protein
LNVPIADTGLPVDRRDAQWRERGKLARLRRDPGRVITRLATWKVWLVTTKVFTAFAGVFFASSAPFAIPHIEDECGQAPPDMRFTSSAADVDSFLATCGEAGREADQNMLLADLFYPAVFGLFIASSLAVVLSRLAPGGRFVNLAWLPMFGAGFDYLENAFAWRALAGCGNSGSAGLGGVDRV